jgi:hypothetical protein
VPALSSGKLSQSWCLLNLQVSLKCHLPRHLA